MTSRHLMIGVMLLLHSALSLLGNVGTHAVLGCQHDHRSASTSASATLVPHQHRGCQHAHCHSHFAPVPSDSEPHALPPVTDDDCAICQFFTRPAEAAVAYHWTPWGDVQASFVAENCWLHHVEFQAYYEVRGPPALI